VKLSALVKPRNFIAQKAFLSQSDNFLSSRIQDSLIGPDTPKLNYAELNEALDQLRELLISEFLDLSKQSPI
jgi:hypothetical protein